MLTPEQLIDIEREYNCGDLSSSSGGALFDHIDAQQARIAELESNAEAHTLAMKAGKAMLAAETARADAAEQDAARYRWLRDPVQCESPGDYLNIAFEQMDAAIDADMKGTE